MHTHSKTRLERDFCRITPIATAPKLSEKQQTILTCALAILREGGDAALTMRKLAERSGMRLSNVQYYFKSRDDVLKAMVTGYMQSCTEDLMRLMRDDPPPTPRARAERLIRAGLQHGESLSDMCRIFRELWAIASRNDVVREQLETYYRDFAGLTATFVLGDAAEPKAQRRLQSLLIPYFEGYSITAQALPMTPDDIAAMLTDIAMAVAQNTASA